MIVIYLDIGDIVESLRCRYVLNDKERQHLKPLGIWSSQLGATLSDEIVHPEPEDLDIITAVSIKHGNLVDSITLHYGSGSMVKAGGNGGSTNARVDVDVAGGERVIGFYGGIIFYKLDHFIILLLIYAVIVSIIFSQVSEAIYITLVSCCFDRGLSPHNTIRPRHCQIMCWRRPCVTLHRNTDFGPIEFLLCCYSRYVHRCCMY